MPDSHYKTVPVCLLAALVVLGTLLTGCENTAEMKQTSAPAPAEAVDQLQGPKQQTTAPAPTETAAQPQSPSQQTAAPAAPRITRVEIRYCTS